ncbi:hypothetical protein [Pengzhenrongella phosphoraccumulans]|uniref:hypothetical protein n=1 Tax=Pengzhenrongella phosphoraccumulans TaxID=3114394 RepID=UPI00388F0B86
MLGTYDAVPSAATQQGVGQIIGWRLGSYGLDPQETMNYYTGAGENSRFSNQNVSIQRIFGHRDTAFTACPGNGGYAALPNIREIAAQTARSVNSAPVGVVDAITTTNNSLTVSGWAFDPDTSGPNEVHVYIDGVGVALLADQSRPDVAAAFGIKDKHGYSHTRSLSAGSHGICVYSIDTAGGANTVLSCRTVTVGAVASLAAPFGALDSVVASSTGILLNGWSLDPDTTGPTDVHIYVDGAITVVHADQSRADIASIFGKGDRHGFTYQAALPPGRHDVCVHAINTGAGANTLLGCSTVVVVDTVPIGSVDSMTTDNTGISVSGWTLDQDTWASTEAHVYIDGVGTAMLADQSRPDVAAAFGRGDKHGFSRSFPAAPGSHGICVFGINTSGGTNVTLTCRTVVVPDSAPIGVLDAVVATRGALTFSGWTLDPDTWASNQVHIYIDGVGVALAADLSRPDIAAAFGRGDRHGFSYTARVAPGLRSMCVYGINTAQGPNTMLNCRTVVVP